ncbi:MAG: sugar ABC transporter substrate-binding protein [Selenomonadaceae bacterium]|nr:sugar ABC transporter substrate-binding protein [Selenomonadaceae bacterium]
MKLCWKALAVSCAAFTAFGLAGCGSESGSSGKKVFFAAHADAVDYTGMLYEGVKSRLGSQGAEVEFLNSNGDANMQIDQINEAIAQKPAAIVVLAVDGDAVIPVVEKANEAEIPVIATNRDLNGGKIAKVMSDERQAGRLQGEYMAKHLPQGAKIVYLMGEGSQSSAVQRWEGFKEACLDKRSDIQLLAKADGNWSEAEGLKYMTLWLQVFPKIDAVIAGNDNMAMGAFKALKAAGRNQGVLVSGVDAMDYAVAGVSSGEIAQTVKQDADKTAEAIAGLLQAALNGKVPTDDVKVPFTEITKENVAQFK